MAARRIEDAVSQLAESVAEQLRSLEASGARQPAELESQLDLVLQAVGSLAQKLCSEPSFSPEVRQRLGNLADRVGAWRATKIDVRHYLLQLGEDWRCPACQSRVPRGALVLGDVAQPVIELICRDCGSTASLTEAGRAAFERLFGHLVGKAWQPEHHGFVRRD